MKLTNIIFLFFCIQSISIVAQVGINNENPNATLDVTGDVLVREKLYLENPGSYMGEDEPKLLMVKADGQRIFKYDIENSAYGLINYVQYAITNVSNSGLTGGFNTRIDASKYTLAVHGYYFNAAGNTNISMRSTVGTTAVRNRKIEGQQFYAYVQDGTWWLRGQVNNSQFYIGTALTNIDIYMDVIIYRNDFITKIWPGIQTVNMGNQETGTAPLPNGF